MQKLTSLDKALAILQAMAQDQLFHSIASLNRRLKFGKSTTHRLLNVMERRGFVQKDPATRKYSLGLKVLELAVFLTNHNTLLQVALPFMEELQRSSGETVFLTMRDGEEVVVIAKRESASHARITLEILNRAPLYATAAGKVFLGEMGDDEVKRMYEGREPFPRLTEKTITSFDQLLKLVREARSENFAINDEESYPGTRYLCSGIRDYTGRIVAGVSIVGNALLFTPERMAELKPLLMECAASISRALGYGRGPQWHTKI